MLLDHPRTDVNIKNLHQMTPLHYACLNNDITIVKVLLNHEKIDINAFGENNDTPLHIVCKAGYLQIAQILIQKKNLEIKAENASRQTGFYLACKFGHLDIVKTFMDTIKVDTDTCDTNEMKSPMQIAYDNGHVDVFRYLLAKLKDMSIN